MLNLSEHRVNADVEHTGFYTLRTLRTPAAGKILARVLLIILIILIIVLFLPWQQNIRGYGQITALNPQNRPQAVETVIAGRIEKWFVNEGDFLQKGDTIMRISEVKEKYFDPQLLVRLQAQIEAKEKSLLAKNDKAEALFRQVTVLEDAMKLKTEQAKAKLQAEKIRFQNAKNQFERNKTLYDAGNIPLTKFQQFEYKLQESQADYVSAQLELDRIQAEYLDKINKAQSDLNATQAATFDAQSDILKARNEYANTQIRNDQYNILAPQSGYIVKAKKSGIGETVKEGDPICTIMPHTSDMAVEMFVRAMDVPLIGKGRKTRIQFDGWPALQFSGWPSASVGTFGGEVRVIDYVNSKPGEFRILVVPDPNDEPWPDRLRIGSGTKGWIMLDNVPVWYELWRNLNGFPPSLYEAPKEEGETTKERK